MSYTKILVVIFIALLVSAGFNEYARAAEPVTNSGPRISLGQTLFNQYETHGEIGYEWNRWEAAASIQGTPEEDETTRITSLSRVVKPDWSIGPVNNYYRIGAARVHNSDLVGDFNFRLGIGLSHKVMSVEYFHYSSAGIYDTNTGIDGVMIRFNATVFQ